MGDIVNWAYFAGGLCCGAAVMNAIWSLWVKGLERQRDAWRKSCNEWEREFWRKAEESSSHADLAMQLRDR